MVQPSSPRINLYKLSLFCLGSLSFLSPNLVWAQSETTDVFIEVPTVSTPETTPPPVVAPSPAPVVAPTPAKPVLSAPKVSVPPPAPVTAPIPPQATAQPTPQVVIEGKNTYVDTRNYAPTPQKQPNPVVVVEGNNGCQTVVQNGQLQSGRCGGVAQKPQAPVTTQQIAPKPRITASRPAPVAASTVATRPSRQTQTQRTVYSEQGQGKTSQNAPERKWSRSYSLPQRVKDQVNTALLFPLSIPATITSAFGWRIHPITGQRRLHAGTDIGAPTGTPVLAAYGGRVSVADRVGGYGLMVTLSHEENTQESRYAHLSEILVQTGEWVEQGAVIGLVGSTGNSTGPHLHFEWRTLTVSGWEAVDAGIHIESAMANLIRSMEVARNPVAE